MDLAYDHIAEEALPKDSKSTTDDDNTAQNAESKKPEHTLNEDLQEAYRAFSSSTWGTWLGGHVGNVIKQGESVYREAQQEVTSLGADASRGFATLRARALSLRTVVPPATEQTAQQTGDKEKDAETTPTTARAGTSDEAAKEAETVISRLKAEAAKRLKDIQRAEDAADEALLKFGGNVRNFFRDAIIVKPGAESEDASTRRFESKDDSGKRVIHASRYDAQLHVLHTNEKSFTEDPATVEFATWAKDFDAEKKTDDISADLAKYPELRANMEKLVPGKIPYADFWKRYYFLRHSIETAEARRRDLLKAASAEEEIGWGEESSDEESEEESEDEAAPAKPVETKPVEKIKRPGSAETIHPPAAAAATSDKTHLKPAEPRKSNDEKSQADSDTSYDLVGAASGNPSQAPSSPKDSRKANDSDEDSEEDSEEDSDDEEWE